MEPYSHHVSEKLVDSAATRCMHIGEQVDRAMDIYNQAIDSPDHDNPIISEEQANDFSFKLISYAWEAIDYGLVADFSNPLVRDGFDETMWSLDNMTETLETFFLKYNDEIIEIREVD